MQSKLKLICCVLLGLVLGWILASLDDDRFVIRIIDDSRCAAPTYTIITEEQSIVVTGDQLDYDGAISPNGAEAFISVSRPPFTEEKNLKYAVKAEYNNCETILSEYRDVEYGWILYEFIDDNEIKHTVRSR